jgi:hypothetical protein
MTDPTSNNDGAATKHRRTLAPYFLLSQPAPLSRVLMAWLSGMAVALIPFLLVPMPPLSQQFFNIVRMHILAHPKAFAKNFIVLWDPIPDLAMDLTVPNLSAFMSIEAASWLFIVVTLAMLTSGTLVLGRAVHGRWSILSLLSFLFLYNSILVRGYANNLFALGLALWALAAHVALCRSTAMRTAVSSVSTIAIYFCHLFALGVFALVVTTWELGCLVQCRMTLHRVMRHAAAAIMPLMLPIMLLVLGKTSQHSGTVEFGFLRLLSKLELCLEALAVGNRFTDLAVLAGLCGIGAVALGRGWLTCRPEWRLTVVVLSGGALLVPLYAFASYGVVERFSLSAAFLLPAILGLRPCDQRLQTLAAATLVLLFFLRVGTVSKDWSSEKAIIQSYRTTFATLKPRSVMFEFDQDEDYPGPLRRPDRWSPPLDKIVALATLNDVLVPKLYLVPGHQPVQYSPDNAVLREFQTEDRQNRRASDSDLLAWSGELRRRFPNLRHNFSAIYVAVFDPDHKLTAPPAAGHPVAVLAEHRIYELID